MRFTYVAELGATGNWSTAVFQILFAGSTGQPPSVGPCPKARTLTVKKQYLQREYEGTT